MADEAQGTGSSSSERRVARRVRLLKFAWYCSIEAWYYSIEGNGETRLEGLAQSCDVSMSGVALRVAQPVPVGSQIFVEIVSEELCLSAIGVVARSVELDGGQVQLGIQFQIVPPNDKVSLTRYCGHERP